MAVFTRLNDNDFTKLLEDYNLGSFINAEGIAEGVENTNYKLQTDKGSYILTIYEKRVKSEDLPFFMELQKKLYNANFPCPLPVNNKNGSLISRFNNKDFTIVSFLKGRSVKTISNAEISEAGAALARLHNASKEIDDRELYRQNTMAKDFWVETYSKVQIQAEEKFLSLKEAADNAFRKVENWPDGLPKGVIHGDFFPDNVLFNENKVSGVIDFYMACNDSLAYDLAIAINAWCFEKDYAFNITKAKLMLRSYNSFRTLQADELETLPLLCIGASMRFLSTRLYDYFNRNADAVVSVKDPKEYLEKLKFHLQVKSHLEYGL